MGRRQPVDEGTARDGEEFLARGLRGFRVRIGRGYPAIGGAASSASPITLLSALPAPAATMLSTLPTRPSAAAVSESVLLSQPQSSLCF